MFVVDKAMERGPFINDLPKKNVIFNIAMLVYQRVIIVCSLGSSFFGTHSHLGIIYMKHHETYDFHGSTM